MDDLRWICSVDTLPKSARHLPPPEKMEDYLEEAWELTGWEKDK
jgi:hypothetical protein